MKDNALFFIWRIMASRITISYTDTDNYPESDLIKSVKRLYGDSASVTIAPTSNNPETCIHFGLNKLITEFQFDEFFSQPDRVYQINLQKKRREVLDLVTSILDTIIMDNEDNMVE